MLCIREKGGKVSKELSNIRGNLRKQLSPGGLAEESPRSTVHGVLCTSAIQGNGLRERLVLGLPRATKGTD